MTFELFPSVGTEEREALGADAHVLRGFALPYMDGLMASIEQLVSESPFRQMQTPGGFTMSVALSNCGHLGWTTDQRGYRYTSNDPVTGRPWPAMPMVMRQLACEAAAQAGFANFEPDACLINRYLPGARMSLHQDRNERDFTQPIVSV